MQRLNSHPLTMGKPWYSLLNRTHWQFTGHDFSGEVRNSDIDFIWLFLRGHVPLEAWTIMLEANMMERKHHVERSRRDRAWCLRNPILEPWAFEVFGSKEVFEMIPTLATDLMATSRESLRQHQTAPMPMNSIKDNKCYCFKCWILGWFLYKNR